MSDAFRKFLAFVVPILMISTHAWATVDRADKGFIDLESWQPTGNNAQRLDGQWYFFDNEFIAPTRILTRLAEHQEFVEVPKRWESSFKTLDDSGFGHATYVLKLNLPSDASFWLQTYGLQVAGRVFVLDSQGQVIGESSAGDVGVDAKSEYAVNWYPLTLQFDTKTGDSLSVYLVVHISNYSFPRGGFEQSLVLSNFEEGRISHLSGFILSASTLGILIIIALYHLSLYLQRREDPLPAYFAGFCLSFAMREAVMSGFFEYLGLRNMWTSYEFLVTLEYLSMPLLGSFAGLFIERLVSVGWFVTFLRYWIGVFGLGLIVVTLSTPVIEFSKFLIVYQVFLFGGICIGLVHLLLAAYKKFPFAGAVLSAFCLLAAGGINDILYARRVVDTAYIAPYTFVAFVLMQASLIAQKFARVFEERDASQNALLETYQQLDDELLKREQLVAANERLSEENRIASEQLIQADKLATLGTMVAGVAHDIANPTGLIMSNQEIAVASTQSGEELLDTCFKDVEDDETKAVYHTFQAYFTETKEALKRVNLGTQRIAAINSAIRNQARRDHSVESVLLRPVIDECLVIVGNRLKGIDIQVDVADGLAVEMIRSQFGQALMNLVANAADAISDLESGGQNSSVARIKISASQPGNSFYLTIEDSGPGIPKGLREKVLEPFFTTKSLGKGTGLGMPIVLKILDAHKMTLTIDDSEELGGASFIIKEV